MVRDRMAAISTFIACALFTVLCLDRTALGQQKYTISEWPVQQKTGIMMPFQLANGHIRTPPFKIKGGNYLVDLIVRTDLSLEDWCCGIKTDRANGGYLKCAGQPTGRLRATWTLWDGSQLVAQGPGDQLSNSSECDVGGERKKELPLGGFKGKRGKQYILDLELSNFDPAFPITDAHLFVWPSPAW